MGKKPGFIGLGRMGRGVCGSLIKKGVDVTRFDHADGYGRLLRTTTLRYLHGLG
jgi:3-hydroxyisobutyrate dehydrogenase-like beta-hydroxyacid dehydrogenase